MSLSRELDVETLALAVPFTTSESLRSVILVRFVHEQSLKILLTCSPMVMVKQRSQVVRGQALWCSILGPDRAREEKLWPPSQTWDQAAQWKPQESQLAEDCWPWRAPIHWELWDHPPFCVSLAL